MKPRGIIGMWRRIALGVLMTAAAAAPGAAPVNLVSVGSDTLGDLMLAWVDAFQAANPQVRIQIQTPGSAGAPTALAVGSAELGPMSRAMTEAEEASYRRYRGHAPGRIQIGLDAIAIFVHPDNPIGSLSLQDVDAVWSQTRRCGRGSPIAAWSDLAVAAPALINRPILRIGRNTASGTFEFFRDVALCEGVYRDDVVQLAGAGAIVAAVAQQPHAIGHAGVGHVNALVKVLPLRDGKNVVAPTPENIENGRYPLARPLYIYFNRGTDGRPSEASLRFLQYVLSGPAQTLLEHQGFVALSAQALAEQKELVQ
ncbi:phosphate ABC transporter substrate-binding protein [Tahibacter amnicola]|uniref:Phosphate ABC transporter substrate-binding protein n=1 Tax=Tahibacter amnicola TaxID=2976241 RepID=A0ABY6BCM3_9GAMM|nr:phosphate ABC transporter substrate-binding protein [Tahibacter amnicola]UXI66943.1 phosphate ABC transporter substrate-binding protein [Tahibacter amnicola]